MRFDDVKIGEVYETKYEGQIIKVEVLNCTHKAVLGKKGQWFKVARVLTEPVRHLSVPFEVQARNLHQPLLDSFYGPDSPIEGIRLLNELYKSK